MYVFGFIYCSTIYLSYDPLEAVQPEALVHGAVGHKADLHLVGTGGAEWNGCREQTILKYITSIVIYT